MTKFFSNPKNSSVVIIASLGIALAVLGFWKNDNAAGISGIFLASAPFFIFLVNFTGLFKNPHDTVVAFFAIFGIIIACLAFNKNDQVVATVAIIVAIAPFLIVERIESKEGRERLAKSEADLRIRLDRIDAYLGAAEPDRLAVAIFDDLLVYLPVYVADSLEYFEQEGITITYKEKFGDEEVAESVRSSEAHLGLCDPCMCARKDFAKEGERVLVLAPLVTRSAARAVTRNELKVRSTIVKGGQLTIASYKPPSTTFVMAAALKEEWKNAHKLQRNSGIEIGLQPIEVSAFKESNLPYLLNMYDVVMLWEPFLTIAKSYTENTELEDFLPNNLMYSAVIMSERLLRDKPTLGIRIFRALSRASYAIQLASQESMADTELLDKIVKAASNRMSVRLSPPEFKELIRNMARTGLFPLISHPDQLTGPLWRDQFHEALNYRRGATEAHKDQFNESLVTVDFPEHCHQFFCPLDLLHRSRDAE